LNLKESISIPLSSVNTYAYEDRATDTWPEEKDGDEFSPPEDYYEQVKPSWKKNGKIELYGATDDKFKKPPNGQIKWKDIPKVESKPVQSDDGLNALLQVKYTTRKMTFHTYKTLNKCIYIIISGGRRPCKCSPETSGGDHEYC